MIVVTKFIFGKRIIKNTHYGGTEGVNTFD